MKVKLFRRGILVGLVNDSFHRDVEINDVWDTLGLPVVGKI